MSAARSVTVVFANQTTQNLVRASFGLQHGIWSGDQGQLMPPQEIQAGSSASWESESSGLLTGTQGSAIYAFEASTSQLVSLTWDNPFSGQSVYTAAFPPSFSVTIDNGDGTIATPSGNATIVTGGGNTATITYTLTAS
jgi:hypothetical protein